MTTAPFRIKGVGYRGHMEYVAQHLKGGLPAMNAALADDQMRVFFAQPFLAGGWYDVMPLAHAGDVCARLAGVPLDTFLRTRVRHQVQLDLGSVYGFLARFATRGLIARGVSDLLVRYFDFLQVVSHQTLPDRVETHITGAPEPIVDWLGVLMVAYAEGVFEQVGMPGHTARYRRVGTTGRKHGMTLFDITVEIRWSTAGA